METHPTSPASAAKFKMIDIGEKADTQRRAIATGIFYAQSSTILRIQQKTLPKGDVLTLSEVAGIQGAKNTSQLLPLCHPLSLTSVRVWHEISQDCIRVFCEAKTVGKTGVEMEALGGVTAALLCIYDLTKGIDPALRIGGIQLEIKEGGKSGQWLHPGSELAVSLLQSSQHTKNSASLKKNFEGIRSAVIVLSDRCSKGEAEDRSGPVAEHWLTQEGSDLVSRQVLPDDATLLRQELVKLLQLKNISLIITSGGTGLSPRDITPETVLSVCHEMGGREVTGLGELLRAEGAKKTSMSWLSRSTAVLIHKTLIVCLPGSPAAVKEGLDSIGSLILHVLHVGAGGDHEKVK